MCGWLGAHVRIDAYVYDTCDRIPIDVFHVCQTITSRCNYANNLSSQPLDFMFSTSMSNPSLQEIKLLIKLS